MTFTREHFKSIDRERPLTDAEALQYLHLDDGSVPCSRYGRSSSDVAPIAVAVSNILTRESDGIGHTINKLDYVMGLAVNDHDDPYTLIRDYGTAEERELISDLEDELEQGATNAGRDYFETVGWRESPLSGEWSGESMPEIGAMYGIDLSDSGIADAFEQGFFEAAHDDEREGKVYN